MIFASFFEGAGGFRIGAYVAHEFVREILDLKVDAIVLNVIQEKQLSPVERGLRSMRWRIQPTRDTTAGAFNANPDRRLKVARHE
jgi:hypothetical protein